MRDSGATKEHYYWPFRRRTPREAFLDHWGVDRPWAPWSWAPSGIGIVDYARENVSADDERDAGGS